MVFSGWYFEWVIGWYYRGGVLVSPYAANVCCALLMCTPERSGGIVRFLLWNNDIIAQFKDIVKVPVRASMMCDSLTLTCQSVHRTKRTFYYVNLTAKQRFRFRYLLDLESG